MECIVYTTTGETFTLNTDENMTIVKFCKLLNENIFVYDNETCIKSENVIAFEL